MRCVGKDQAEPKSTKNNIASAAKLRLRSSKSRWSLLIQEVYLSTTRSIQSNWRIRIK